MSGIAHAAAQLDLSFCSHPTRGTFLDRRRFRWPYVISRGFRDATAPHKLALIVQTASGAIQAADRLTQRIHVGPQAAALITTQGATPVHRAPAGLSALDDILLDVEDGGLIEYLPEPRILFPEASLEHQMRVRVHSNATALIADSFITHDPQGMDGIFRHYASALLLERPDGELVAADRADLASLPVNSGRMRLYRAHGMLMLVVYRPIAWLEAVGDNVAIDLRDLAGVYAAACPLPNASGILVRIAALDGQRMRIGLQRAMMALRSYEYLE
jgi:urease accessory protein